MVLDIWCWLKREGADSGRRKAGLAVRKPLRHSNALVRVRGVWRVGAKRPPWNSANDGARKSRCFVAAGVSPPTIRSEGVPKRQNCCDCVVGNLSIVMHHNGARREAYEAEKDEDKQKTPPRQK